MGRLKRRWRKWKARREQIGPGRIVMDYWEEDGPNDITED